MDQQCTAVVKHNIKCSSCLPLSLKLCDQPKIITDQLFDQ